MAKLISYNVNGIRAALKKGFGEWLQGSDYDIVCIQESKAQEAQIDKALLEHLGYESYWVSAEKKGYSGVGVITRIKPDHVEYGMGNDKYDSEGRVIRADFGDTSILNIYYPSGSSGDDRQAFKMEFLDDIYDYIQELKKKIPNLIVCGDYNICHTEIDIHNPKQNKDTSGFKPEEREWVSKFIDSGFIDSFRTFQPEPHHYSWWSYRANARNNNKGWRIDYFMVAEPLKDQMNGAKILPDVKHSDHCPIYLDINL
jgi:exodeoxyribonuclease-3